MIQIEEPMIFEYPGYCKNPGVLPFFEEVHFRWRHLPEEIKIKNPDTKENKRKETETQRINRLINKAKLILFEYNKIDEI